MSMHKSTVEVKMSQKIFAYVRTNEKNKDEQVSYIRDYCKINKLELDDREIIIDKIKRDSDRDGYKALVDYMIRSGDILIIRELELLGSNLYMISEEWQRLQRNNINLIIIDNNTLSTHGKNEEEKILISNVVVELLSYICKKDKKRIKENQAKGIQALKDRNNGKGVGRPKTEITKEFKEYYKMWRAGKISAVETFNKLGLTKTTFYRLVKEYENTNNS